MSTQVETAKGKKGHVNGVSKVDMGVAKAEVMLRHARAMKLDVDGSETADQLSVILSVHYETTLKKDDLAACDGCGGVGDANLDECPFCGSRGAVGSEVPAGFSPAKAESTNTARAGQEVTAPSSKVKEDEKGTKNMSTAMVKAGKNGAPAGGAMTLAGGATGSKMAVAALDQAVEKAKQLVKQTVVSWVQLGSLVASIRDQGLWKQRLSGVNGKQAYATFEKFCAVELQMSPTLALNAMSVSKQFSDAEIARVGITKLALALKAPEEDRERIVDKVKSGATKREVEKEVRAAQKKAGKTSNEGKKTEAATKARQANAAAKAKVTVVDMLGKQTVKLYARPTSKEAMAALVENPKEAKRAKNLGHEPFGFHQLVNGVRQEFSVRANAAGEWELVINTIRES
jgi:hypothetical protein